MVSTHTPEKHAPRSGSGAAGEPAPAQRSLRTGARRALDVVVAMAVLIPASPALLLAALAIRLSSPGPVLYRSERVGWQGRRFSILKLRTMHMSDPAATGSGSFLVGRNDARVFPVGWFLRKSRIDELPQLLNVLFGEMALVGPRPRVPEVIDRFYTPEMRRSLAQRPGLTSPGTLHQLTLERKPDVDSGLTDEARYGAEVLPRKVLIDQAYFARATLWSDLRVIGLTLVFLLRRARGKALHLPDHYTRDLPPAADAGQASGTAAGSVADLAGKDSSC